MSVIRHCPDGCAQITAARLTLLDGELAAAKAEKRLIVEMVSREREQLRGAVAAGDALADAVSDIMADDPESVLHTWVRRWREAAQPGGR
jgi:hypothetical protein